MLNCTRMLSYLSGSAALFIGLLGAQPASAASCLTAAQSMAEIMNTRHTDNTLILAHRGSWGNYNPADKTIPENSIAAAVNRRPKGTPFVEQRDGYDGCTVRAGCGVGRA